MKRRSFLKTILGLAGLSAAAPVIAKSASTIASDADIQALTGVVNEYLEAVSPHLNYLVTSVAREFDRYIEHVTLIAVGDPRKQITRKFTGHELVELDLMDLQVGDIVRMPHWRKIRAVTYTPETLYSEDLVTWSPVPHDGYRYVRPQIRLELTP